MCSDYREAKECPCSLHFAVNGSAPVSQSVVRSVGQSVSQSASQPVSHFVNISDNERASYFIS